MRMRHEHGAWAWDMESKGPHLVGKLRRPAYTLRKGLRAGRNRTPARTPAAATFALEQRLRERGAIAGAVALFPLRITTRAVRLPSRTPCEGG